MKGPDSEWEGGREREGEKRKSRGSKKIKGRLSDTCPGIISAKKAWMSFSCPLKRQSLQEQMGTKIPNYATFAKTYMKLNGTGTLKVKG